MPTMMNNRDPTNEYMYQVPVGHTQGVVRDDRSETFEEQEEEGGGYDDGYEDEDGDEAHERDDDEGTMRTREDEGTHATAQSVE